MKKFMTVLLLCTLLLTAAVPAFAAAGSTDDPLISQSYIINTFLPRAFASMQRIREDAVKQLIADTQTGTSPTVKTVSLHAGDCLSLGAGQQLTLISGCVNFKVERGTLLNVTAGRSSTGGDARQGNRYLLCGGSAAAVTATGDAVVSVSVGVSVPGSSGTGEPGSGKCPFIDVAENAWYYADVVSAYRRGLVNGVTADSYQPAGTLTAAQAVKLAACMHQLYHSGSVTLKNSADGRAWYMSYVDYALKNGLMETGFQDYDGVVDRGGFIRLFFRALPESEYPRINLIMDGAIPDVATDAPLAKEVYTFYMAGILTGYAEGDGYLAHAFGPNSTISRAEVAAIMNRMFDPAMRKRFTMD